MMSRRINIACVVMALAMTGRAELAQAQHHGGGGGHHGGGVGHSGGSIGHHGGTMGHHSGGVTHHHHGGWGGYYSPGYAYPGTGFRLGIGIGNFGYGGFGYGGYGYGLGSGYYSPYYYSQPGYVAPQYYYPQATPTYVAPSVTYNTNDVLFDGGEIRLFLPDGSAGAVKYALNGYVYTMQPGESQKFRHDRRWIITILNDTGDQPIAQYSLSKGQFKFKPTDKGWDVVVVEASGSAPNVEPPAPANPTPVEIIPAAKSPTGSKAEEPKPANPVGEKP